MNHKTWMEVGAELLCTMEIPKYNVTAVIKITGVVH